MCDTGASTHLEESRGTDKHAVGRCLRSEDRWVIGSAWPTSSSSAGEEQMGRSREGSEKIARRDDDEAAGVEFWLTAGTDPAVGLKWL